MTRIGVVGLGAMGGRVAGRLLAQGYDVAGTNRTRVKADALIAQGLVWYDTPRATSERSDVVISMVTNDAALDSVTGGPNGILAGITPGSVYIDMSTVSPSGGRSTPTSGSSRSCASSGAP